jgi:hypothetical protein
VLGWDQLKILLSMMTSMMFFYTYKNFSANVMTKRRLTVWKTNSVFSHLEFTTV